MNEVSPSDWALVISLLGLMCANAFYLGLIVVQGALRLTKKKELSLLWKWGVEKDLLWPHRGKPFIGWGIALTVGAVYTSTFAFFSTFSITEGSRNEVDQASYTFLLFLIAWALGFNFEAQRTEAVLRKVERLEGLREVFRNRFRPSDLLSVYESLKHAPPLFWDEYTQLADEEINEETNQKYRERAGPYRYSLSIRHNRVIISLGVLAIAITLLVAVRDFLW